ncbi:MAG: hypothetical protein HKO57_03090 [Akkermansiaceae bacterium]|nr:hypothetical protein [Akkermansiaceae bacterium]
MPAYLASMAAAGLLPDIDGRWLATAVGVPPVILFAGLSVLGLLTKRAARILAGLWLIGALGIIASCVTALVN